MLEQYLVSSIFTFLLIFCRVGTAIMILPGFGESYVSPRIRLCIALMIALLLAPVLSSAMPRAPGSPLALTVLIVAEILTGAMMGAVSRILISAMHITGSIISFQSSLAAASIFDITQGSQSTLVGNFLGVSAVVLLFATNLHHLLLRGVADSYTLLVPGAFPPVEDFANLASGLLNRVFSVAVQLCAPQIVVAMILYMVAGILSRLMPAMQVFFIIIPAQLLLSFFILMVGFSAMMMTYLNLYEDSLGGFIAP